MTKQKAWGRKLPGFARCGDIEWAWEIAMESSYKEVPRAISDVRFSAGSFPATCRRRALYEVCSS